MNFVNETAYFYSIILSECHDLLFTKKSTDDDARLYFPWK